jgi:hypothetical protein
MVKHQPSPIIGRGKQNAHSCEGDYQSDRSLDRAHPPFAHDPPERQQSKNPEGDQAELFMRLHHPVYRLTVVDMPFGLQSRDDGCRSADGTDNQRPEAHLTKDLSPGCQGGHLEQQCGEKQGGRKVVERSMQAGPVVTEHDDSISMQGER